MRLPVIASILLASTAFAMPNPDTRFRPGANHHLGDDSFVERFGRAPATADSEKTRMKVHLEHVRAWLASRPATRPELAARRTELLGFLDEYIAKGITPENSHLPWRTAVFIDDGGAICAVGYLIERSVGRALPEKIAAEHRYDFLEDIAAAMPEVETWVRASGFTLDELASIQPAYASPNVITWRTWDLVRHAPPDGAFDKRNVAGTFEHKSMQGTWTVKNDAGAIVGKGELVRGNGTWKSFYADGKPLAEGPYVDNVAHGEWTFFHPSGNVAAEGKFVAGMRSGRWRFYNDTKAKTLIATGKFAPGGSVTGVWKHFDADGTLLARTYSEGRGNRLDVVAASDGVIHQIHQFQHSMEPPLNEFAQELERLALGADEVFVHTSGYRRNDDGVISVIYDSTGRRLEHTSEGWTAADCHWSKKRRSIARSGDIAWLHEMLFADTVGRAITMHETEYGSYPEVVDDPGPTCAAPVAVSKNRGAQLDKLLAPREAMRAQSPLFVRELVLNEEVLDGTTERDDPDANDLRRVLTAYTIGYVEWPHIDGRFDRVFATMAGRLKWEWFDSDPEADDTNPLENAQKH